jgi:hypothetical protein
VEVTGVGVGEVVAVALRPADEVVGVAHMEGKAGARVRAVEGDRDGGVLLAEEPARLVPGVVQARACTAVLRIEVVRLPGDVREEQEEVGGLVVADREGDVGAIAVTGGEDGYVRADRPVRGDLQPPGEPPVVAGDGAVGGERGRLDDAGETGTGGDLGGPVTGVVPDPVDVDGELLRRIHRDVEVDRLTGGGGSGGGESLDLTVYVVGGTGAAGTAVGEGGVGVPGDDLTGVAEVVLAAAQPGKRALAEGIGDRVGEGARFPPPDLVRPHAAPSLDAPRTTVMRRLFSAGLQHSTSHNARTPSPFVAN